MENTKYLRNGAAHLLIWGCIFALPFLFNPTEEISQKAWLRNMAPLIFSAFLFYLNYFYLIDQFLFKDKTKTFLLLNFALIALCLFGFEEVRGMLPHQEHRISMHPQSQQVPSPGAWLGKKKGGGFGKWFVLVRTTLSFLLTAGISVAIRSTQKWRKTEEEKQKLEHERLKSELSSLQYQLQPHFFFNALNNIYSLMDSAPAKAKESIHGLAKLMRHILYETSEGKILLSKEIEFLESFVKLMRLRLTDQVSLKVEFPTTVPPIKIAPLLLIPLVENAFKHGVSTVIPSQITIQMRLEDKRLFFLVENTFLKRPLTDHSISGIGVANLKKRLSLLYLNRHTFKQGVVVDEDKITGELYRSELILAL